MNLISDLDPSSEFSGHDPASYAYQRSARGSPDAIQPLRLFSFFFSVFRTGKVKFQIYSDIPFLITTTGVFSDVFYRAHCIHFGHDPGSYAC